MLPDEIILSLSKLLPEFSKLPFYKDVSNAVSTNYNNEIESAVVDVLSKGLNDEIKNVLLTHIPECTEEHFQIMSVIFRSPYEKIILESAKFFLNKELPDLAIKYLQLIVRKPGCDWWSFYRSCYLLRQSFSRVKDVSKANHYQELLLLSNENFPF